MLYLEDYLEMIEHLPQELRDRFTEMREMDLQVQNSMDSLEKRVKTFFGNAKKMKSQEKETEYESIRKDYYKTLEDADEKVQLGNHMYDLVARYLRRLDQETHKFKMELEADHVGITEILEKRSQELDQPPAVMSGNSSQKENRYSIVNSGSRSSHLSEKRRDRDNMAVSTSSSSSSSSTSTGSSAGAVSGHNVEHIQHKRLATVEKLLPDLRMPTAPTVQSVMPSSPQPPPQVKYSLDHIGAGGTAIAAAASQAIAATQQMQQGRRTASLKASYEAIHSAGQHGSTVSAGSQGQGHEISISKELAGAAQTAIAAIQDTHKKHKKKSSLSTSSSSGVQVAVGGSSSRVIIDVASSSSNSSCVSGTSSGVSGVPPTSQGVSAIPASPQESSERNTDVTYDPNEPRYCICDEVAFGDMVACDNKTCPYEWYHYPCVGITDPPKGKWYCPQCTAAMKRRGSRKN
ncbi:inhibitor of growth family, member 3 [Lycorma delicatula]|uniref:inhibitor of growth family, member 3 n=1 Tax=Lycorma delicatula TaxID=130591 RepID=UPI003F5185CE